MRKHRPTEVDYVERLLSSCHQSYYVQYSTATRLVWTTAASQALKDVHEMLTRKVENEEGSQRNVE
jgi:hypothetical protein